MTDRVHAKVIAMSVAAERVVDRQDVSLLLGQHGGEQVGRFNDGSSAERSGRGRFILVEPRVAVTQNDRSVDAEGGRGHVKFGQSPLPKRGWVGGQSALTSRRDHQHHSVSLTDASGQGAAHQQRLVVRMCVERHKRVNRAGHWGAARSPRGPSHNRSSPLRQGHMRILHVTDVYLPRLGGIEAHVADLADAQRLAGDVVDILTLTSSPGPDRRFVIAPPSNANAWTKAAFIRQYRTYGGNHGYDVIHVHCSAISPLCFATITAARTPTLITVHSLWRRYTALYRAADYALRWSRLPVIWSAVSETAATDVRRAAATPLDVAVLPNGVDLGAWGVSRTAREADHLRIVSVMRLAARKRPIPLLRVLHALRQAVPSTTRLSATIAGDGPQLARMQRYLRRHNMTTWVTLVGQLTRSEVAAVLANSDVFVAPATLESFGIAALEARVAGLTVVGRANTGLSDFVGEGGVLLDSDQAMTRALIAMACGAALADVPNDRNLNSLSWVSTVERTRRLYHRAGYRRSLADAVGAIHHPSIESAVR